MGLFSCGRGPTDKRCCWMMLKYLVLFEILTLTLCQHGSKTMQTISSPASSKGHCIWYGECFTKNNKSNNCVYNGPAKPLLNEASASTLKQLCPHLFLDNNESHINTCCDVEQIAHLKEKLEKVFIWIKRCPSCLQNFLRLLCDMTCASNQSDFLVVEKILQNENTSKLYITEVNLHITTSYLEGTYNSCKQVYVPALGQLAMDLMCGQWGAFGCSYKKWFDYMGDAAGNPYVPFQINYIPTEVATADIDPLNPLVVPCSQSINAQSTACSCVDCEQSCPAPPPPLPPVIPFTFLGFNSITWWVLLSFVLGTALFLLSVCCLGNKRTSGLPRNANIELRSSSIVERLGAMGAMTDRLLERGFVAWGRFCAEKPWVVIILGCCAIVGLSYGIMYIHVTTDPVELWAAPESRSRVEREFFDSKFEPFYRTEQIILRPVGLDNIVHNTTNGPITFGPVFQKDF